MDVDAVRESGSFLTLPDGHRVWYRRVPGAGSAVVLLHGVGGNSYPMRRLALPFEAAGRATVLIDLRGHGFSDSPAIGGYALAEHTADVLAVIDHLGITQADIIGHCFGAMIAVRIAVLRPGVVRRLALISASLKPGGSAWNRATWGAIGVAGSALGVVASRAYRSRVQEQYDAAEYDSQADIHIPRLRRDFRHTSLANALGTIAAMAREDLEDEAATVHVPTLVIHGRRDAFVPWRSARRFARRMPGARFDLRERDGHVSHLLGRDTRLVREVFAFLEG